MQLPVDIVVFQYIVVVIQYTVVEKEKKSNNLVEGVDSVALVSITKIFDLIFLISLRHILSDVAIDVILKLVN